MASIADPQLFLTYFPDSKMVPLRGDAISRTDGRRLKTEVEVALDVGSDSVLVLDGSVEPRSTCHELCHAKKG